MFDLERQIQQWRQSLTEALGNRPEALEELENHLRDEVQRQMQTGQSPEQAWALALQRLGSPQQLASEFHKLPGRHNVWLPAQLALVTLGALAAWLGWFMLYRWWHGQFGALLATHIFAVTLGYTSVFIVGALAAWSILTRALAGWDARRTEALRSAIRKLTVAGLALTVIGVALGGWWAQENLGRAWGWDPKEIGGLSVLAWQGLTLLVILRPRLGERAGMLLGIAGNVVVSLSWFGPALTGIGLHSYGAPTSMAWILAGFNLIQVLLFGLAFVPPGRLVRSRTIQSGS
jgi:hypothetical protein